MWLLLYVSTKMNPLTMLLFSVQLSLQGSWRLNSLSVILKCVWNALLLSLCPAAQPQSVGLIAGTIATGVLAIIICSLLVVVTLFYWKNKNKYDEEEIPNEIRCGFDLLSCCSLQCMKNRQHNINACIGCSVSVEIKQGMFTCIGISDCDRVDTTFVAYLLYFKKRWDAAAAFYFLL